MLKTRDEGPGIPSVWTALQQHQTFHQRRIQARFQHGHWGIPLLLQPDSSNADAASRPSIQRLFGQIQSLFRPLWVGIHKRIRDQHVHKAVQRQLRYHVVWSKIRRNFLHHARWGQLILSHKSAIHDSQRKLNFWRLCNLVQAEVKYHI